MILQRPPLPTATARGAWGQCESEIARYGESRTILRVFPPDMTREERGQWRMLHVWPALGFAVAVAVTIIAVDPLSFGGAVLLGAILWLAPLAACWIAAQPLLGRIHERWVTTPSETDALRRELLELGSGLTRAEAAWRAGTASEDEFRRQWRVAYDATA